MRRLGGCGLFDKLGDNEDWHSRLRANIQCAEIDSADDELKESLATLNRKLDSTDECFHIVTVTAEIPTGVDSSFLEKELSALLAPPATVKISGVGRIVITSEMRGSKAFVTRHATVLTHIMLHPYSGKNKWNILDTNVEVTLSQPRMAKKNPDTAF